MRGMLREIDNRTINEPPTKAQALKKVGLPHIYFKWNLKIFN